MDAWNLSAQRAAASRERAVAFQELVRQLKVWIRPRAGTRAPLLAVRNCVGADC